jgi:hypothetical protein
LPETKSRDLKKTFKKSQASKECFEKKPSHCWLERKDTKEKASSFLSQLPFTLAPQSTMNH